MSEEVRAQQAQREKYKNELGLHEHWRAQYFEEREQLRDEAKQLRIDNALLKDRLAEMAKQSQECTQHFVDAFHEAVEVMNGEKWR